jgi:hypothetical protein
MVVTPFLAGVLWYRLKFNHRPVSSLPSQRTTQLLCIFTTAIREYVNWLVQVDKAKTEGTFMPSIVGYTRKFPLSSQRAFIVAPLQSFSNSRSTASRRPNSISSTLYVAVSACCISCTAVMDSSYFRVIFPVRGLNIRIWKEGCDTSQNVKTRGRMSVMWACFSSIRHISGNTGKERLGDGGMGANHHHEDESPF